MERFLVAACHRIESANGLIGEIQTLSTQTLRGTLARFNIQKLVHGRQMCAQPYHVFLATASATPAKIQSGSDHNLLAA